MYVLPPAGDPDVAMVSSSEGYVQRVVGGAAHDGRSRPHLALQLRFKLPPSGYANASNA